jgi:ornithine cyclodeaminase
VTSVTVVGGALVRELLPMADCIAVMERALTEFGRGTVRQPVRESLVSEHGVLALMPAALGESATAGGSAALGFKAVTVFPGNHARDLPTHQALVALHDPGTGRLTALVDGTAITTIRTAAVSAVATRALARPGAASLAIIGTGVQAASHLEAVPLVVPIERVAVWGRRAEAAEALVERARAQGLSATVAPTPEAALAGADVVVTATSARDPVIRRSWLADGAHVNAVGACFADTREIDAATIAAASVYVDDLAATFVEAGDILLAIRDGTIGPAHVRGSIGAVLAGTLAGRVSVDELTLFESLGLGLEDVAAATEIASRARVAGAGVTIDL